MISNSKIDKIGEALKESSELSGTNYQELLKWRNSFEPTLDYYFNKLKTRVDEKDRASLARRLKRIESIQIKLKRFKSMRLSTLQDIAGVRCVLKDVEELDATYELLRGLKTKHILKRLDDYQSKPKEDGYRGIHLVYQSEKSKMIEIQLRTELQHTWATAVEIYGELQNTSFKTGGGDKLWREFFQLLSSVFAYKEQRIPLIQHLGLTEKQIKRKLIALMDRLSVIERLNASTNNLDVIVEKYNSSGKAGKYALLELDLLGNQTRIEIFNKKDVAKAIEIYTYKELTSKDTNIVFVNIEDLENIRKSYPNYFMDTRNLLEILSKIKLGDF